MDTGIHLFTGGARSGKSSRALSLAKSAERPFFIATAEVRDEEMEIRVAAHKTERGGHWTTIEAPVDIAGGICAANAADADFIVVDCLTIWTANVMEDTGGIPLERRLEDFLEASRNSAAPLAIVTNEVGMGIVPANKLARDFRDAAGRVNAAIAAVADTVSLMVSGIPVKIKG